MRKLRAYSYALLIGTFIFLNLKCERTLLPVDSSKKIDYEQGNIETRVVIKLFDSHSGTPITGAMINIDGVGSSLTDSKGMVIFDSIRAGIYPITCSKTGYEDIMDQLSLTLDSNSNTVPILNQSNDNYFMAKKGAAVRGNLYYEKEGKFYPATAAAIECQLINNQPDKQMFQKPLRSATSVNGTFIFTDLPEYTSYKISVRPFSDGTLLYKQDTPLSCTGKSTGDTIRVNDIILGKFTDGNFIVMVHNLETFTKTEGIVFDFSEAVDISKLSQDSIYVYTDAPANRILLQKEWQNNNKRLVIKPFDGIWDPFATYTLVIRKIVSITGKSLDNSAYLPRNFSPTTTGALGNIANLMVFDPLNDTNKVDYNTNSIILDWTPLANALDYQIYQKKPTDSSWFFLKTVSDTFTTISTSGSFNLGKQLKFIVLGRNSTGTSPLQSAAVLTVRDQIAPVIEQFSIPTRNQFNRAGVNQFSMIIDITIGTSYIPEPMDTTKKPVFKVIEGSYFDETYSVMRGDSTYHVLPTLSTWSWTGLQSGVLSVIAEGQKDGSYDTLMIDFTGLTDIAGNKADTTYGAGILKFTTLP